MRKRKPMYAVLMGVVLVVGTLSLIVSQVAGPEIPDGLFNLSSPGDRWLPEDPGSRHEVMWQVESVSYSGPLLIEVWLDGQGIRYRCGLLQVSSDGSTPFFTDRIAGVDVEDSLPIAFRDLRPGEDLIIAFGLERTGPTGDPGSIMVRITGIGEDGKISSIAQDIVSITHLSGLRFEDRNDPCDPEALGT